MKTINLKYSLAVLLASLTIASCDDFLEVPPKGAFLTENYYADRDQVYGALIGVYDALKKNTGGFENMVAMMNAGSDDHVAGGGSASDGLQIHAFDDFTLTPDNVAGSYWDDHYQGVFRANTLLSKIDGIEMDSGEKARIIAETKALRAFYYFNLVRMFGNIPLLLEPLTATNLYEVTQVEPSVIYNQMETDLLDAIQYLPPIVTGEERGRLTQGAAKALLGKIFLYNGKNAEAAAQFADVNGTPGETSMYGYKLLTNFSDLWVFSNTFNSESILECTHSNQSRNDWDFWGSGRDEGNTLNVMVGIRSYSRLNPASSAPPAMPGGWSFSTFTQKFYDVIKDDPRFSATVFDIAAYEAAGDVSYVHGDEDLGYYLNKFMPRPSDVSTLGGAQDLNFQQHSYIIRLADTYLMEAEALGATGERAQDLLDAVRARVGLPSVPVSMAAIKAERRIELAGEGHRFFDLVRWGDAATVLAEDGFVAGKNEIFPIPTREINGTKLLQNPGYEK